MLIARLFCIAAAVIAALLGSGSAAACIWDTDTLAQERARFPEIHELLAGRFARHSDAYYHWRIADRQARLARDPANLTLRDDLAAAYDKLRQPQRAVRLMRDALERDPDRYETHANLGTYLLHAGQFESGIAHIERALAINPDAHFGRERQQLYLAQYLLARQRHQADANTRTLPLMRLGPERHAQREVGFAAFVLAQVRTHADQQALTAEQREAALRGVLGMLRFGNHSSPVLLEALGDLLVAGYAGDQSARQLAARAYLKAAMHVDDEAARAGYRELAGRAAQGQVIDGREATLDVIERAFEAELADGQAFFDRIAAQERRWIAEGVDVDAAYQAAFLPAASP